jgi:DNA helicase-2/ATP-dependent DNA helicase PcrA
MATTFTRDQFEQFLGTLKFPPNPFQLKVLESIAFGSGNIVVSALAGSGKTSLLVQTAHLLNKMAEASTLYMAFNVKIRDELNERLPKPHIATNSHRLGLQVLNSVRKSNVDVNKWRNLCKDIIEGEFFAHHETYQKRRALESLCSKVMLNDVKTADYPAIAAIAKRFHIEGVYNSEEDRIDERIVKLVKKAIDRGMEIWQNTGAINFDEMLYIPVIRNLQPQQYRYVFVDECQDLNILQQELAYRSCEPGGRMIFVGDQRQAIYGFAGADAESFDRIIQRTKGDVLPLNICYRCPTSHIELAKKLVPALEAAPNAAEGIVEYANPDDLYKLVSKGSLVMCRLNAPLISAYFGLISNKIAAKVMGKDIGADLIRTLDRVAELDGFEYDEAVKYLDQYRNQQVRMLSQKEGSESQIEVLNDKIECLIVCVENFNCSDLQCLKDVMLDLFGDDDKENWKNLVALCTVHKAKGLEADETFILRPEKMPLTWSGQQAWEAEQEQNIKYVALTRSKRRMVILGEVGSLGLNQPLPLPLPEPTLADAIVKQAVDEFNATHTDAQVTIHPPFSPSTVEDADGTLWPIGAMPAEVEKEYFKPIDEPIEIVPIVVPAPRRTLDEIVGDLTISEIDRIIEVLQVAREKLVQHV